MILHWIYSLFSFFLGSCIGSFLNVVVYRVPAGQSILYPPSRCPKCKHPLAPYDNIPVFGWLSLGGRCRYCKTSIAIRYPLVEAFTGCLFLLVFWQVGWSGLTLGYWCLAGWLIALALIDWDTLTLPDSLTRSGLVAGLVFQVTWGFWQTQQWSGALRSGFESVQGAVIGLWLFELICVGATIALRRQAMGRGDIKLAAMIGAWLGWAQVFLCLFIASLLGSLIAGGMTLLRSRSQESNPETGPSAPIPFGPFLAVATFLCALWGEQWLASYLQLFS
ncbi:MAG: prepilin peptidase [Prochlorotrichaceae cyanobacterium]